MDIIKQINAKIKSLSPNAEWTEGRFASDNKTYKGKRKDVKHVSYNNAARRIEKLEEAARVIKDEL